MAGLRKQKKIDWKDTNLALFGSDTEKSVKKSAAEKEKAWRGCGQKPGLKIWRIVKFKVTDWPAEDYGSFYDGDSYIILHTYKSDPKSEELDYDVHFWIGKHSTQDEYGTAAYKTVELDTFLDDKPVQHREVMGFESDMFKSYFKVCISYWKGGADSGFRRVEAKKYTPRLLHVHGDRKKVQVKEVKFKKEYLNNEDVFLIDLGLTIFQWNGDSSNKDERYNGGKFASQLKSERGGKPRVEVYDNAKISEIPDELLEVFGSEGEAGTKRARDKVDAAQKKHYEKILFRLSDASSQMTFTEVARGPMVSRDLLSSDDVFILDTGHHCYVWVGASASHDEIHNGLSRAHNYLKESENPWQPVTVVDQGKEHYSKSFLGAFD